MCYISLTSVYQLSTTIVVNICTMTSQGNYVNMNLSLRNAFGAYKLYLRF